MDAKRVVAVLCERTGAEALYVDGKLKTFDSTIYMGDVVNAVGGTPIVITHMEVSMPVSLQWPEKIEGLSKYKTGF